MSILSILIPTYNRPEMLRVAIQSVIDCFGNDVQVIVGDNGETQVTGQILASQAFAQIACKHLKNPPNSTYTQNLQRLIEACESDWFSIIHDDDFYCNLDKEALFSLMAKDEIEFIFTDHWVCDVTGKISEADSIANSINYRRSALTVGPIDDPTLIHSQQRICIDGFYAKTSLAKAVPVEESLKVFGDALWIMELVARAKLVYYFPQRTFAYRVNEVGITASGFDHAELYEGLRLSLEVEGVSEAAKREIFRRMRRYAVAMLRNSLRRKNILRVVKSLRCFVSCWRLPANTLLNHILP